MSYNIKRICWCDKTYNGYEDSPYWLIRLERYRHEFGLTDDGRLWCIYPSDEKKTEINSIVRDSIVKVIKECKLQINSLTIRG